MSGGCGLHLLDDISGEATAPVNRLGLKLGHSVIQSPGSISSCQISWYFFEK